MMLNPASGLHQMQQLLQQHIFSPTQLQSFMQQHTLYLQQQQNHQVIISLQIDFQRFLISEFGKWIFSRVDI